MPREGKKTVNLPTSIVRRIDQYLDHSEAQYGSRDEFCRAAVRRLLDKEEARLDVLETEGDRAEND